VFDKFLEINWFTKCAFSLVIPVLLAFSGIITFTVYGQKHDDSDDDKSA